MEARVLAIEEFSVFDGAGMRTTVFLSGCPLRCTWCHNPEGQTAEDLILRSPNGCTHCRACEVQAENGRFTEKSVAACPHGLLRHASKVYTPMSLVARLENLLPILNAAGGGVTFSGGEPTASAPFLFAVLDLLHGKTHRAVETCGYTEKDTFAALLTRCDHVLFDIKIVNDDLHKHYTGVSNVPILANFKTLTESGVPFTVRTPLIPSVTDTEENLRAIAELLQTAGVDTVELLPYHRAAGSKYPLAGRVYTPDFDESLPVHPRTEIFSAYGIRASII